MISKDALHEAVTSLSFHGIDEVRLESELLLMHVLRVSRSHLYANLEQELSSDTLEQFWRLVERRCSHEPTAYILGHCQFFGIDFYVDSRALIPRPESEILVEEALKFVERYSLRRGSPCLIAEVGTGSGAIAVALALHLPQTCIYAMDISALALEVAAINCQRYEVGEQVRLLLGDMLEPLPEPVDLVVANLPYIENGEIMKLCPEIWKFEPWIALDGGEGGLGKVCRLLPQSVGKLRPGGSVLLELGQGQMQKAASLVRRYFPGASIEVLPDLMGIDRVLNIRIQSD
jgi:release factor glutamine methyltransferase